MKEYDLVELIQDRDCYKKKVSKKACLEQSCPKNVWNGKWQVVFSKFYTGKDIADIMVKEEDFIGA